MAQLNKWLLLISNNLIQIQMQNNPGHQPKRFEEYVELEDGSGFTLKGSEHVFLYDKYGGWKDEYGNYYNENGEPADPEEEQGSQRSISQGSWAEDEDEYEKQFGPSNKVYEEFENQPVQSSEQLTIGRNIQILDEHIKKDPLRVNFEMLDLEPEDKLPTQKEILIEYRKKVKGLINVFIQSDSGDGYFVVSNVQQATKLINLEGENIIGLDFSFDVETFDELRNDPLSKQQLETKIPQFIALDENDKVYTIHLGNHTGFADKKLYKEWEKKVKSEVSKFEIIKMRANDKKQKVPVVKTSQKELDKIRNILFDGKQVTIEQYTPIQKDKQQVKEQEPVKKEQQQKIQKKEEQTTQTTQQPAQEKAN